MSSIEDLKDLVHTELLDAVAGARPPDSVEYTRHLPDPSVVDFLVQNALLPILTGIVSGILTNSLANRGKKKDTADLNSTLHNLRITLDRISRAEHFNVTVDNEFNNTANTILHLHKQIGGQSQTEANRQHLTKKVAAELERFHVGPQTAQLKATRIVAEVLKVIEPAR